nr:hypothetical protein [Candidatus Sigynarchaeum springense]
MRIAVSNASPLILLAKVGALGILTFFFDKILIPPTVHKEVTNEGHEQIHPDAILIKKLVDEQRIVVRADFQHVLTERRFSSSNIHPGELEALELALSLKDEKIILLDDEEARKIARSFNLHVKGTLGLLIDYRKAKQVDKPGALVLLDELNKIMYLSADLYRVVEKNLQ